jgi:Ca2+-binding RTX toxin-like protein
MTNNIGIAFGAVIENAIGGWGDDKIVGNAVANRLEGGLGDDRIFGGTGGDTILGGDENDHLYGEDGDDNLDGDVGNDNLDGGAGDDKLSGGDGDDIMVGGVGDDKLFGNAGYDDLFGGDGDDLLDGGPSGEDRLVGGDGGDTYVVDFWDTVTERTDEGRDTIISSDDFTLSANVEILRLVGTAKNATGNALDNELHGTARDNVLDGRAGADTMSGGGGNDRYVVDDAGDVIIETTGRDRVDAYTDFVLSDGVEELYLKGSAVSGTGNALSNVIKGNALDNELSGGGGKDYLTGGGGSDVFVFDAFDTGASKKTRDVITDFQRGVDHIEIAEFDGFDGDWSFSKGRFSKDEGELHYKLVDLKGKANDCTLIEGDIDGNGKADFRIEVDGLHKLAAGDFLF